MPTLLPAASPIAAFGERKRSPLGPILFIIALLITAAVVAVITLPFFTPVPLPSGVVALAFVPGQTSLPDAYPPLWRDTLATSKFPVLLGARDENGSLTPFAVAARFSIPTGHGDSFHGPFAFVTDEADASTSVVTVNSWPWLWSLTHGGFLQITTPDGHTLHGALTRSGWTVDETAQPSQMTITPSGDITVDAQALPIVWKAFQQSMAQDALELPDAPNSFSWSSTQGNLPALRLTFDQTVPSTTISAILRSYGMYATDTLTLPDGDTTDELLDPDASLVASSSQIMPDGDVLTVNGATLQLGQTPTAADDVPSCPGSLIAYFSGVALNRVATASGLFNRSPFSAMSITANGNDISICVN